MSRQRLGGAVVVGHGRGQQRPVRLLLLLRLRPEMLSRMLSRMAVLGQQQVGVADAVRQRPAAAAAALRQRGRTFGRTSHRRRSGTNKSELKIDDL